ncbi:MAG: N-acetyltransferase [Candidatus Heimdallarchaeota archaeon]|nr:MAG: N-acetyltransferase [Candidatus Heimdallarchaeota archaeon]
MTENKKFRSKMASFNSAFIAASARIYGPSTINERTIIDSYVLVGYPKRGKSRDLFSKEINTNLDNFFDEVSTGSIIGKKNHIRPFTTIYEDSSLKDNVETGTSVVIRENCHIGAGSIIGSGSVLDSGVSIGKNARVQSNNFIPPKITIGDNVFLGPCVQFANDKYPMSNRLISTFIEDNVVIGIGAIILGGITIEEGAVIGAGSLVTKNVPSNHVVIGAPARKIMSREEYDQKQKDYERSNSE